MYVSEILERSSRLAERSAALYRRLAEQFGHDSERRELCHELAFVEETQAKVLREELASFQERDELGDFLPEFAERMQQAEQHLANLEQRVSHIRGLDEATSLLVALQQTNLEGLYDDLVVQGDPSFRIFVERLEAALADYPRAQILRRRRKG
ncbi:MAG: hypothetical protein KatS3mg077_1092 [Candidatus Binatia bacterium]|nr:MAG: hypothetical protein KatS3mg077_1092 [Candidatus Binatia bacterium]